jgi:hypothetical protein
MNGIQRLGDAYFGDSLKVPDSTGWRVAGG